MGSLIAKVKEEVYETPERESIFKRIEDPRSPTEEISRTPIEVPEDTSNYSKMRQIAYSNALKQQNQNICESSPRLRKNEKYAHDKKHKQQFSEALDTSPILLDDESTSLDVSTSEKENVQ